MKWNKNTTKALALMASIGLLRLFHPTTTLIPYEKEKVKIENYFPIENLFLITKSDSLGNITYYFVTQEQNYYQSITEEEIIFPRNLPNLTTSGYYWIPDIDYSISIVDVKNFFEQNQLDTTIEYTKDELQTIENRYNRFTYDPYLNLKNAVYEISNLILVWNDDGLFSIYDKSLSVEMDHFLYYYNILDLKSGLKINKKSNSQYETSLIKKQNKEERFHNCDITFFLNSTQLNRGYLYYYEIETLLNSLNIEQQDNLLLTKR